MIRQVIKTEFNGKILRKGVFSVTITHEDLEKIGHQPEAITDQKFHEIVEKFEVNFQENYWQTILKQTCCEVLKN